MKQLLFTLSAISVMATSIFSLMGCSNSNAAVIQPISFYDVPLVCFAAPEIGCGSLTKPLFIEAKQVKEIKEIWLNRAGTRIAVEWNGVNDEAEQERIMQPLFAKYNVKAAPIRDSLQIKAFSDSLTYAGKWYKGLEIDQLSLEEAGVIARDVVKPALDAGLLAATEVDKVKADVTEYFKEDLVKVRSCDELRGEATQRQWKDAIIAIFEKYISSKKAQKAYALYEQEKENCHKDGKGSCNPQDDCCNKKK
jgi:hypothetical protein